MQATFDAAHIPSSVNVDGRHDVGGLYFRTAKSLPIFEVTAQYNQPMLVVFGGQDNVVSYSYAMQYVKHRKPEDFVLYPTLDHGMGGKEHEEMSQRVLDFLTR